MTDKRRRRKTQSNADYVLISEFSDIDGALKALRMSVTPIMYECRQRRYFTPKPTRGARKRRGILLEKRKAQEKCPGIA